MAKGKQPAASSQQECERVGLRIDDWDAKQPPKQRALGALATNHTSL
jgi:hypothetical protein